MALRLYNTLTQAVEPVTPLAAGKLTLYTCGVTVYDDAHVGHLRAAYSFEVLRRAAQRQGWQVRYVRNLTDVDDKIIERARAETPAGDLKAVCRQIAARYTDSYHADLARLELPPPDVEPKATEHIPQMLHLIKGLVAKGHAYAQGGDVYFRVRSWPAYGRLSHQQVDTLRAGARIAAGESKEDALDFALWKAAKPGEPSWDSPWGPGRPGWHIECSAMSMTYLGESFDVHGGGLDLIFPHHENEIAQSEAATGRPFVRCWVHSGLITVEGQKMAKSVGNVVRLAQILERHLNPDVLKLCFAMTHYRSPLDFTWEKLDEAAKAYGRFVIVFEQCEGLALHHTRSSQRFELADAVSVAQAQFDSALAEDLNTPEAVAGLFALTGLAHRAMDAGNFDEARKILERLRANGRVLGLFEQQLVESQESLSDEIRALITQRDAARRAKNFSESDRLRLEIQKRGYVVEDTAGGTVCRPA